MGTVHGDDHSLGEQLAVAGLGGGTSGSLSPPNAAPQCKEPLCALIPSPGSSRARPGGTGSPPWAGGSLPQTSGTSHCPLLCVSTTHAYVCVHVPWVAGEGPCYSKPLATSRTIQSCQGRPRHSSCRCWLCAVPVPVPAPLPIVPQSRCRSPQHRASALCEHRPRHGRAGECQAGHPGRR